MAQAQGRSSNAQAVFCRAHRSVGAVEVEVWFRETIMARPMLDGEVPCHWGSTAVTAEVQMLSVCNNHEHICMDVTPESCRAVPTVIQLPYSAS